MTIERATQADEETAPAAKPRAGAARGGSNLFLQAAPPAVRLSVESAASHDASGAAEESGSRRGATSEEASRSGVPPLVHEVLRSPGRPLDAETRALMEPRFGQDLGHVRVHTDQKAAESARTINALAYTVGPHVVFGAGEYAPHTMSGKGLLAHELAHVAQQSRARVAARARRALSLGAETDAHEREADRAAEQVLAGERRTLVSLSPVSGLIQRTCYRPPLRGVRGCIGVSGDFRGETFLFVRGCDDFRTDTARPVLPGRPPGEESALRALAATLNTGDRVEIHGYASEEGDLAYNESLSCLRAQRAMRVIMSEVGLRGVNVGFQLFMHGEMVGRPLADRRKVVINLIRSSPRPTQPTSPCVPSVVTGRTPVLIYTHGAAASDRDFIVGDFPYAIVNGLPILKRLAVYASIPRPDVDLFATFTAVIGGLGGAEGMRAVTRFRSSAGGSITYGPGTNFSTLVAGSLSFRLTLTYVRRMLDAMIRSQARSCRVDYTALRLPRGSILTLEFLLMDSAALKAVIGGTQALWISINSFSSYPGRTYTAVLSFDIYDDFGVDEDDLYAPGLIEFYVLQHFRTAYRPFVHRIIVEQTITGSY